jgi:hypothetical protein
MAKLIHEAPLGRRSSHMFQPDGGYSMVGAR